MTITNREAWLYNATTALRHQESPHRLKTTPISAATSRAPTMGQSRSSMSRNAAQLTPQLKSAGSGQGGAARQRLRGAGGASVALAGSAMRA